MSAIDNQALPESELLENSGDENTTDWQPVTDLLRRVLGIDFGCYRPGTVGRRISRRMELLLANPRGFCAGVERAVGTVEALLAASEPLRDPPAAIAYPM